MSKGYSGKNPLFKRGNYEFTLDNGVCLTYHNLKKKQAIAKALKASNGCNIKSVKEILRS